MKTLRCTCGQVISGETGAELYAAVEAHLTDHAAWHLQPADAPHEQAEPEQREKQ